jgi:catechol 2,3-dioxygenase-like lactoylglutathione lyase family enzyme
MITGLNHVTLAVKDVETSFRFYREVLGFKPLCKWDAGAYFLVGEFWFCLNADQSRVPNPCYTHYAFSVSEEDFEAMSRRIQDAGAQIFKDNTSPGNSLYFLDPDGHKLEIHTGSWQSRVEIKKLDFGSWKQLTWFV